MATEITAEHDAAHETVEAMATFATLDRSAIVTRLAQDTAAMRRQGADMLFPRWIRRPLDAMRVFEEVHRRVAIALFEVRRELKALEAELANLRQDGSSRDAQAVSQKAARLLCREADLRERVESRDEDQMAAARDGIARILDVTLRSLAKATAKLAREASSGEPAEMRRVLAHLEGYERLVREAQAQTGGALDLPHFREEFVDALRRKLGRRNTSAGRPAPRAIPV
jgi:hypothetical protein